MKLNQQSLGVGILSALVSGVLASPPDSGTSDVAIRAFPNAPNGYAPANVSCPSTRPSIRSAASLSTNETDWLRVRREKTVSAMEDFFGHVKIENFDAAKYIRDHAGNSSSLPNIGIAVSGGGYRALMNGAGALKAFDSRTENSTAQGQLGGLLQSATYLSGLSGGGWLLGSLYVNNDSSVAELQAGQKDSSVWRFDRSILEGPTDGGIKILDTASYYTELFRTIDDKRDAGFEISITDIWGRALSYQLVNAPEGGPSYTWSSISMNPSFKQGDVPFPLLVADGRNPGEIFVGGNATVFEFNPFEFGTFDPTIFGFVPLEFLGSKFEGGRLPSDAKCVRGFDNAGFIMGTSSSLFNQFALNLKTLDLPGWIADRIQSILDTFGQANNDIADYKPNPFFHYSNNTSPFAKEESLHVVDGGEDLQNIPLHPLIQPNRHVDVIFAIDSSADNEFNWPNGTALVATYQRSLDSSGIANGTSFPAVPDQNTFVNLGLNRKPTFFGCESSNTTNSTPLIVYIPNSPYVAFSNVSTFDLSYNMTERNAIIDNGYNVATMGNGTQSSNWSTCVGCAMLSRSFERTGTQIPEVCQKCFNEHCWDGTVNSTTPNTYQPTPALQVLDLEDAAINLQLSSKLSIVLASAATLLTLVLW
ncbi:Lysophospholipase 1 [Myotisia sp. PD_48]|nr:Lysophospholipase 1 [Myotisia sp. PD_48]